ncbi:brain-specific angiogenesis inhibitor 1-like [Sinocyclocheilus anshuiensis]|uniref:brain-specific angiogenesis inhibitor 1-like n=1 Tax=Sinocyclocheilus anshuiensis TaxID=1608454 RepID=UPI0007B8B07C|nr:PREDICTED: brain-specific angiogenesis inhibitor 1-like [Sinocyclocheilus anshuiensis]
MEWWFVSLALCACMCVMFAPGISTPSGPASATCATLEQSRFFGVFSSKTALSSAPCSWTLQNPDPRRYTVYMKITKPTESCTPRQIRTFQFDSFLETSRTYLGMESFDEVVRLCDASSAVAYLESSKQFLQVRKVIPSLGMEPGEEDEGNNEGSQFNAEFLVVGKRNPSMPACEMLCQWLEDCLATSTHGNPCGIMMTPCQCWEPPKRKTAGCYRGGVYTEKCSPTVRDSNRDAEIMKGWNGWGRWSECSNECGGGVQVRSRACQPEDGVCEGVVEEGRACNPQPCIGQVRQRSQGLRSIIGQRRDSDGTIMANQAPHKEEVQQDTWSSWSVCSVSCGEGLQSRSRSCMTSTYSTQCTGPLRENRPCNNTAACPVNGAWDEWAPWSLCSSTCGRGYRDRVRTCKQPQHGGEPCRGPVKQTKFCNIAVCPVDGYWNDWSAWTPCSASCSNGTMQRTRECNGPSYGGSECRGEWQETTNCFLRDCPVDGRWLLWSSWGSCSKSCGGGHQLRQRVCEGPFFGGEPCNGDKSELRNCNEKRCPEPHEICGEENYGSVVWKKTPAGDTAAVSCPSDATGLILRRCTLDAVGLAFWENPTHIKCISKEFQDIQTLMRDHMTRSQSGQLVDGVSEVLSKVRMVSTDNMKYSGDLLAVMEVLRNGTEIFRGSKMSLSNADVENYAHTISNLLQETHREKWNEAQLMGANIKEFFSLIESFIDMIGRQMRDFQDIYEITDNLELSIQKRPRTMTSDVTFPLKGWRGIIDWVRNSEEKVTVSRRALSLDVPDAEQSTGFVTGIVLYRNLAPILSFQSNSTLLNSKVVMVTVKPNPGFLSAPVEIDFPHLHNGTVNETCIAWDESESASLLGSWSARGCRSVSRDSSTTCVCDGLSTFALIARPNPDLNMDKSLLPSVTMIVGCGVSSLTLLLLLIIYVSVWKYIRSERSVILINFCLSIICSNALILISQTQVRNKVMCALVAAFLHFFFLSSFCWVLTEAWHCIIDSMCSVEPSLTSFCRELGKKYCTHPIKRPEYSSHTLTLRREKGRGVDPSCGKPVYVCNSELFKQLDADLALAQAESVCSDGSSYVLLPNTTSTLRAKPKDDSSGSSKYNISTELPQARLMHLSGTYAEPQAAYAVKTLPADRVSVSYSERDSPIQNIHNISSESHVTSSLGDTFDSMNSMMSKSETISTLSMSSLEVSEGRQKSRYAELDFEKIMHTRKRHQNMFQDHNRKTHHAEKDRESPASDSKSVRWSVSSAGSDKTNHSDKQQGAMDRSWESMSRSQASPPAWVRKDMEPLQASPPDLQGVEWEKAGATIPLVGQDIIDLQTEVWSSSDCVALDSLRTSCCFLLHSIGSDHCVPSIPTSGSFYGLVNEAPAHVMGSCPPVNFRSAGGRNSQCSSYAKQ